MVEFKSTRTALGDALIELADSGADIAAVAADTSKAMHTEILGKKYPERSFDCGIAEQNMMMIAAGLAASGKVVFAASYSVFTSMRVTEQLRTFICYPKLCNTAFWFDIESAKAPFRIVRMQRNFCDK